MTNYSEKIAAELRSEGWTVECKLTGHEWQVEARDESQLHFEAGHKDLAAAFVELEQLVRLAG